MLENVLAIVPLVVAQCGNVVSHGIVRIYDTLPLEHVGHRCTLNRIASINKEHMIRAKRLPDIANDRGLPSSTSNAVLVRVGRRHKISVEIVRVEDNYSREPHLCDNVSQVTTCHLMLWRCCLVSRNKPLGLRKGD